MKKRPCKCQDGGASTVSSTESPGRPKRRGLRPALALPEAPGLPHLQISTHDGLAKHQDEIFARFAQHPQFSPLLLINPVLAFAEMGVKLSPDVADHVLRAIQHPPKVRQRRGEIEKRLAASFDGPAQPLDPKWVARALFEKLKLVPLDTQGLAPSYRPAIEPETLARLQAQRPVLRRAVTTGLKRPLRGTTISLAEPRPSTRRMDLDAALPKLAVAAQAPAEVTLEQLYFYKDSSPVARDLLELGVLQRRSFPIHSGDSYRKIRAGEKPNAFRSWITSLRFSGKSK